MNAAGCRPTTEAYNELIDMYVRTSIHDAWKLVEEMETYGLKPNTVTYSILLTGCNRNSEAADFERIMALVRSVEDEMDEMLLGTVCEACIRVGRKDLLRPLLSRQRSDQCVEVKNMLTFATLIRANGYMRDVGGAWDIWNSMRAQQVTLRSGALGCMVEALVSNGDPQAGYELLTEMRLNPETRGLINSAMYASVMRGFSLVKLFDRVWAVYEEMLAEKVEGTLVAFNVVVDACARNGESGRFPRLLEEMRRQEVGPDMATCSTILKCLCSEGRIDKALELLEDMRQTAELRPCETTRNAILEGTPACPGPARRPSRPRGAKPAAGVELSTVMFNELIETSTRTSIPDAWKLLRAMETYGLKPDRVTVSILLKSCQRNIPAAEAEGIMAVLGSVEEGMDEVLLTSECEALMRVGRGDLLRSLLARQRSDLLVGPKDLRTFGTLIRAHGYIKDARGAWDTWNAMLAQHATPTSFAIGCMVEALVVNGDTQAGYELLTETRLNPQTRGLINSVIYGSVLKGFSHLKRFDDVWAVYEEMLAEEVEFTIVTFNALVDACARSFKSDRIPGLLEEMRKQKVRPDMVTYSTILKSYCNECYIEKAFELVEDMKKTAEFRPCAIVYHTLLDGCARLRLYKRGMAVVDEMQARGVRPCSITLALVAKLASRSGVPHKAFELCRALSQRHRIELNTPVYNNLLQACVVSGNGQRACVVFRQMLAEGLHPDSRTYMLLLRCCIGSGRKEDAAGFLRAAEGLPGAHPETEGFGAGVLQPKGGLGPAVLTEVLEGIAKECGDGRLASELLRELKTVRGIEVNPALSEACSLVGARPSRRPNRPRGAKRAW